MSNESYLWMTQWVPSSLTLLHYTYCYLLCVNAITLLVAWLKASCIRNSSWPWVVDDFRSGRSAAAASATSTSASTSPTARRWPSSSSPSRPGTRSSSTSQSCTRSFKEESESLTSVGELSTVTSCLLIRLGWGPSFYLVEDSFCKSPVRRLQKTMLTDCQDAVALP